MTILASDNLPTRVTVFADEFTAVVGSITGSGPLTTEAYSVYASNGSATNGDSFSLSVFVRAGTYTVSVLGFTQGNLAILDWYLDNVLVSSGQDWYSASLVSNVVKTFSVTIAADGYHVLKAVINGKNASSSGFVYNPVKVWLKQSSDLTPSTGSGKLFAFTDLPVRATLWHDESTVTAGGALAYSIDTLSAYNYRFAQVSPANGDAFTQSFFLRAGSYVLSALGLTGAGGGLLDWYIDGSLVLSGWDYYSASSTWNVIKTGNVTIVGDGYHTLRGVVNGKNASSSNFAINLQKMWFRQAAD